MMAKSRNNRMDKRITESHPDTYRNTRQLPGDTICTSCGALFREGRWIWPKSPQHAHKTTCPACRRINDNYPAGVVEISGSFYEHHASEILNLVNNESEKERTRRPLERLIEVSSQPREATITTTGIHIARRIGDALSKAYKGDVEYQYGDSEHSVRIRWQR